MVRADWLAVIPARFGSKGVPRKNIQMLGEVPLVLHTIKFAQRFFAQTLLSTDDKEVASIFFNAVKETNIWSKLREDEVMKVRQGIYVHKRAQDDADSLSPIREVLFKIALNPKIDSVEQVVLLQPTSPFREEADIARLESLAAHPGWTSIFSVKDVGGNHPNRMYTLDTQGFALPIDTNDSQDNVARQTLRKIFIKDGAYYLFDRKNLMDRKFIGGKPLSFQRNTKFNVNIDSQEDLILANALWGRR